MANLIFSVFLNTYEDTNPSNAPSLNNFQWNRALNSIPCNNPQSSKFSLAPGENRSLFSGVRTLLQDNTTNYSISLKPFTTNTYVLTGVSGTLPNFRTPRSPGADATTQVTVTSNGPLQTFASTGGTPFSLISGSVAVGDFVRLGSLFNAANQGEWQIIARTATSFTIINELGVAEGPITLGSGYAAQVSIYSALGVQANDILSINGGFSAATVGSYQVTGVGANFVEFFSANILPIEGPIQTQSISIYSNAKNFVYVEADQNCSLTINGVTGNNISPFIINNSTQPGVFLQSSIIYSLSITNNSTSTANCFLASVE